jgi:hypothetical protein
MICQNCKYFNTSENYNAHLGWCEIEFPTWLYEATNIIKYDVYRVVNKDDTCSFWDIQK